MQKPSKVEQTQLRKMWVDNIIRPLVKKIINKEPTKSGKVHDRSIFPRLAKLIDNKFGEQGLELSDIIGIYFTDLTNKVYFQEKSRGLKLELAETSKKSSQALTASNIRKELKYIFPDTKFRVTSSSFAGGNSCDIDWKDGASMEDVEFIIQKYKYGSFNGYEDMYEYKSNYHKYGQVQYVSTARDFSKEAMQNAIIELGYENQDLEISVHNGNASIDQYKYHFAGNVYAYLRKTHIKDAEKNSPKPIKAKKNRTFNTLAKKLKDFISNQQMKAIEHGAKGEEKEFFLEKLEEYANRVKKMPKTYEQDGKGDNAIVYLHYFTSGSDFYILERDMENEQYQAFGYTILNGDTENAELGYISIIELLEIGAELDLYWKPIKLGEVK